MLLFPHLSWRLSQRNDKDYGGIVYIGENTIHQLPLNLNLISSFIIEKPSHWTLKGILEKLKQECSHQEITKTQHGTLITAQYSVFAALELSWSELNQTTQQVATLLSLFALDAFAWKWVKSMGQSLNWNANDVESAIEELYRRRFVQSLEYENGYYYIIHPLIREFLPSSLLCVKHEYHSSFFQTWLLNPTHSNEHKFESF